MKKSRRGQVRACGHVWYPWNDGVATMVGDKFKVTTWKFGDIHQSKVFVRYPGSKDPMDQDHIGICLAPGKTRTEAMQRGLDWVAAYKAPDSPDELFPKLFRRWRTIYRRRADIIDHLFFVIGNGYSWLDGAIVSTSDDGEFEDEPHVAEIPPGSPEYGSDEFYKLPYPQQKAITDAYFDAKDAALPIGPLPDDGRHRNFYPVGRYSAILYIPDDVRPEWLAVAYEAALMLRDRQTPKADMHEQARCDENIAYGKKIVAELDAKYPHLKDEVSLPPVTRVPEPEKPKHPHRSTEDLEVLMANIEALLNRAKMPDPE